MCPRVGGRLRGAERMRGALFPALRLEGLRPRMAGATSGRSVRCSSKEPGARRSARPPSRAGISSSRSSWPAASAWTGASCATAASSTRLSRTPTSLSPGIHYSRRTPSRNSAAPCATRARGRATSVQDAHGEVAFWEEPLLRGGYIQASCGQCHAGALKDAPSSRGQAAVSDERLSRLPQDPGRRRGRRPDLTFAGERRKDPNWHIEHFKFPQKVSPAPPCPLRPLEAGGPRSAHRLHAEPPQGAFRPGAGRTQKKIERAPLALLIRRFAAVDGGRGGASEIS